MHVPPVPYILGRDPSFRRHETEYMLVPPGPTGRWGYALFQTLHEALHQGKLHFRL